MNLKTNYLGKELDSPLVASASPLSQDIDSIKKIEDAGGSAVVIYSLFEEQLKLEQKEMHFHTTQYNELSAEAGSFFPDPSEYKLGPDQYLEHISKAKAAVNIPIIASINGSTIGGWTEFAKKMQEAGADAIELNIYHIPTELDMCSVDVEQSYIDILKSVKAAVNIPVALKLSPFFTNFSNMAKRFDDAGADALVLFNRFYQPDINLDDLVIEPKVTLSNSTNSRVPMRWIAMLKDRVKADLAATSGIHTSQDVIKLVMAGADVTMMCSALLMHGVGHINKVKGELSQWLESHEYESLAQMQGSMSASKIGLSSGYERAQYMKAITNYTF